MTHRGHWALDDVRLLIFDADDTLRRTLIPGQPCPRAPDEWELLPNVREVLADVDWSSAPRVAVASNQDQVGYGLIAPATAERLLRDLMSCATSGRVRDPLVRFCAHRLEDTCDCRKPAPGMLLSLMSEAQVAPSQTLFVGNAGTDREAAARAGCRFVWAHHFFAPSHALLSDEERYAARDGDRRTASPPSSGTSNPPPAAPTSSA